MENKSIEINLNNPEKIKRFLQVVRTFMSDVDIMKGRVVLDAKSVMGVWGLNLSSPVFVSINSDNVEEIRKFDAAMEEFR